MDIMSDDSSKSFHTAKEGSDADPPATPSPTHRRVQRIPYELRDHIRVFLEERMYGEAVQLLTSLLAAGGSNEKYGAQPARVSPLWIPPPSHLAVLATLAVHPAYTSRPQDGNDLVVAGHALQYLRHILAAAGPVQAGMASAFQFRDAQGRPLRAARDKPAKKSDGDTCLSRRSSGRSVRSERNCGRNSLGTTNNTNTTNNGTVAGSRSESARPRRRLFPQSRSSGGGISSEYADSGLISFDDDIDGSYTGDALADAVHAAADKMAVDDNGDSTHNASAAFTEEDDEAVGGRMATKDSVWARAQDFWHIVAWVMSCSVNEPARWRCWQPWLALVADVLEADFAERLKGGDASVSDSLLMQYLGNASSTQLRRIVQAILADGTQPPSLVREVFDKETVSANPQSAAALAAKAANPKRKLDLDNNTFGDYSDDDESAPPTPDSARSLSPTPVGRDGEKPTKQKKTLSCVKSDGLNENTGFLESVAMRQRLLHLVMLASVYLPAEFAATDSVYRSIAEVLRDSDIFVFSAVVSAPLPAVHDALSSPADVSVPTPDDTFAGLLQHILFTYLPATAPKPVFVDRSACRSSRPSAATVLTPRVLAKCCLPFAANTAMLGANLRMALTIESLFSIAWGVSEDQGSTSVWTPELQAAAEEGVRAREARVASAGKSRSNKNSVTNSDALGKSMLQRSGKRLLAMVQLAAMDAA